MFNFTVFLTLFIPVITCYFPLCITLKIEIDDINNKANKSPEDELKLINRKHKLIFSTVVTIIITIIIFLLYKLPIKSLDFTPVNNFFTKIFPFKKGYLINKNFRFSFITGIVLSSLSEIAIIFWLYNKIFPYFISDYILLFSLTIVTSYCYIWINDCISTQLSYRIVHYFELLSCIINIVAYILIAFITWFTLYIITIFIYD